MARVCAPSPATGRFHVGASGGVRRSCLGAAVSHVEVDLAAGNEQADDFDSDLGGEFEEGGGHLRVGGDIGRRDWTSWVVEGRQRVEGVGFRLRFVGFVIVLGIASFFTPEEAGWED